MSVTNILLLVIAALIIMAVLIATVFISRSRSRGNDLKPGNNESRGHDSV